MCQGLLWNWLRNIAVNPRSTDEQINFSKSPVDVEVSYGPGSTALAEWLPESVAISSSAGAGQVPWARLKGQGDLRAALCQKLNET